MSGSWIAKKPCFLPFEDVKETQKDYEITVADNLQTAAASKGKDKQQNPSSI